MTGYKSVKLLRKERNRGSVIWVRADYMDRMVRVYATKEEATGSEIIKLQMVTIPPTNIFGVYQETGKPDGEAEYPNTSPVQKRRHSKLSGPDDENTGARRQNQVL